MKIMLGKDKENEMSDEWAKGREFWVTQDGYCTIPKQHYAYPTYPKHWNGLPLIHVIERSAYNDLLTKADALAAALKEITELNYQMAHDMSGDRNKAKDWACVKIAESVLRAYEGNK